MLERRAGAPAQARPRTSVAAAFADGPGAVVRAAAELEDLAAAAYLGQAARLQDSDLVARVVAVHSVEARQAAAVGTLTGRAVPRGGAFAEPLPMAAVLERLAPYLSGA